MEEDFGFLQLLSLQDREVCILLVIGNMKADKKKNQLTVVTVTLLLLFSYCKIQECYFTAASQLLVF